MDINVLIPEFLVLSLAGSSLSIAAYSSFKDRSDDQKLLLIISLNFLCTDINGNFIYNRIHNPTFKSRSKI